MNGNISEPLLLFGAITKQLPNGGMLRPRSLLVLVLSVCFLFFLMFVFFLFLFVLVTLLLLY